jgi:membrane protein YdbS with pleckstrin-like domain
MPTKENEKNKCSICGNNNQENNSYCGVCGNELNSEGDDAKVGQKLEDDDANLLTTEQDEEVIEPAEGDTGSDDSDQIMDEIEEGEVITVVRQVKSGVLWSSGPWLIVIFAIVLFMEAIVPTIGIMMAVVVVVPRFFLWLRSSYVLTENVLIYNRGGMIRTGTYKIPLSRITEVSENYGRFGRTLGYKSVVIKLENGVSASLAYIAPDSDFHEQIAARIENNPDIDSDNQPNRELDSEESE